MTLSAAACTGQIGSGAAGSGSSVGAATAAAGGNSGSGSTGSGSTGGGSSGAGSLMMVGGGGSGGTGPMSNGNDASAFAGAGTTVQGIFIPNAHPRLFWTPTRLAQAKAWWASNSFTPRSDIYSMADQLFAYMMTGNQTYCGYAITNTMSLDLSDCTPDKAGCDDARWYGETAILTYDWCNAVMTDSQKSTFLSNWNTWLNNIKQQTWGGVPMSQSNYYWGDLRDEIEWAIASYQENQTDAAAFLTDALTTRYMNDFVPASTTAGEALGGLGLEGGEYGPYPGYYMGAVLLPSLASAGIDLWAATPYWKGTVLNRLYMTPPQQTVTVSGLRGGWDVFPFGDDEDWQNGSPAQATEKGTFMTAAAERWGQSNIGQWAEQWIQKVQPIVDGAINSSAAVGQALDYSSLPLDYYDGGPRYLVGRSDWTPNATAYLWQMGDHYDDGHNHDDWGAFQIHRKGRWLTRETVGYTESVAGYGGSDSHPLSTGFAHNVPFINGNPGVPNQGFPAGGEDVAWSGPPVVNRLESQAGYAYADVDLTGVYHCCGSQSEDGDNTAAVHVEREYWFVRDIETFVVLDRLQSDTAARSKTFVFHCETNPTLVDATHIDCVNGDQQLSVTTLLPSTPSSRTVVDESANVSTPPPVENTQYRVEINDAPNAASSYTLHVLQAMDTTGTRLAPSVVDSSPGQATSGTLTVTLDAKHSLTINKGMSSSGGSIVINGSTNSLRAGVQGFSLDATDTPGWGP